MPFEVMFGVVAALVALGFVAVFSVVVTVLVRSARDPEYRASLAAQRAMARNRAFMTDGTRNPALDPGNPVLDAYNPVLDPGNPASPMFPGNPGNPS